ncbi:hypothetical protein [Bacteroides finegoldii]|uniref:hypothetical protein n=1 Tax=Bacteroides finegoldii TaxID=338188 RepID=UPI00189CFF67|nr:hypothetical protein [Bacteroides finegoldii]
MASKKFDYSNDMVQDNGAQDESESREILRCQRLEQRNNALANEFHDLKPEIGRAYNCLCNLVEQSGALAGTMLNLLDLLKTALPVRLTDADKKALQDELHSIADDAVLKIRKERERVEIDIRRNSNRISLTPVTFWGLVALLIILSTFFAIVVFANVKMFHSGILTEIIVIYSVLIVLTLTAIAFTFYYRH